MSTDVTKNTILQPSTLQEAINIIKFLTTTHKEEITKLKYINKKQAEVIRKLETNRKKELDFLSVELHKYETSLETRKHTVAKQLAEKEEIIQKHLETIDELNKKLKIQEEFNVPEIKVLSPIDSNSDSGVALENDETTKTAESKTDVKNPRKCTRRFADSISFLRRVDFSPMKYKPCNRESTKKKDDKKINLEVPVCKRLTRQSSNERPMSDDDRSFSADTVFSDVSVEQIVIRPKKLNDSMNNHFSDDGSEDTSEEIFDRVMTRSSIRRSVKANPKYKKINRTKSKLLEQVKFNIVD